MILESGASNIFFVIKDDEGTKLVTHPNDGLVLPGVTRSAILELATDVDSCILKEERPIKIAEVMERYERGEIEEIFMSGTAAVITQVDKILVRGKVLELEKGNKRKFSSGMKDHLIKIQRGNIDHPFCVEI